MQYFRFDCAGCTPEELRLETYEQFIVGSLSEKEAAWQAIGTGFSLTDQDAEASYNSLRLVATLDVAPDPAAWRNIQRFVSRVSPKVAQLDVHQIINGSFVKALEENGFLPEARKKLGL